MLRGTMDFRAHLPTASMWTSTDIYRIQSSVQVISPIFTHKHEIIESGKRANH
jgi:hypothetical protein